MLRSQPLLYQVELECARQGYDFELLPAHVKLAIGMVRNLIENEIPGLHVRLDSLSQVVDSLIPKSLESTRLTTELAMSLLNRRWQVHAKQMEL